MTEDDIVSSAHNTPRQYMIVGVDGSEPSKQALRWARYLAAPLGARIEAVAVWHLPAGYGSAVILDDWDPVAEAREQLVTTVGAALGPDLPRDLDLVVCQGYPAKELLDRGKDAMMIIVGSRGHGGFAGLLLGSVSSNLAAHSSCPVLVVHNDPPALAASTKEQGDMARVAT